MTPISMPGPCITPGCCAPVRSIRWTPSILPRNSASERRELLNRLQVLLLHLLKYQYQPERGRSWLLTIVHQRTAIERLLEQSPSLKARLDDETLARVYGKAVREAVIETDLEPHLFPIGCPYLLEQILDEDWLPESV